MFILKPKELSAHLIFCLYMNKLKNIFLFYKEIRKTGKGGCKKVKLKNIKFIK